MKQDKDVRELPKIGLYPRPCINNNPTSVSIPLHSRSVCKLTKKVVNDFCDLKDVTKRCLQPKPENWDLNNEGP